MLGKTTVISTEEQQYGDGNSKDSSYCFCFFVFSVTISKDGCSTEEQIGPQALLEKAEKWHF